MAAEPAPEAEAERAELRLVVGLQDEPDRLLDQLVGPGGDAQRTRLAILLGDVDPPDGLPAPIIVPQELADCLDLLQAHPVDGLAVDPAVMAPRSSRSWRTPRPGGLHDRGVGTPVPGRASSSSVREDSINLWIAAFAALLRGDLGPPNTCPPSPCPRLYAGRLATMGAPSPWGSRPLGDPVFRSIRRIEQGFRTPSRTLQVSR